MGGPKEAETVPEKRLQLFVTHLREFSRRGSRGRKAHGYIHNAPKTRSRQVRKKSRRGRPLARAAPLEAIWGWGKKLPARGLFRGFGGPERGFPLRNQGSGNRRRRGGCQDVLRIGRSFTEVGEVSGSNQGLVSIRWKILRISLGRDLGFHGRIAAAGTRPGGRFWGGVE